MPTPVIAPIIHLNGDRPATLLAALTAAYKALHAAQDALRACAPNARNYYPVDGLFEQARTQYAEHSAHLEAVMQSLVAEAETIQVK